jgi:hypothetical protein
MGCVLPRRPLLNEREVVRQVPTSTEGVGGGLLRVPNRECTTRKHSHVVRPDVAFIGLTEGKEEKGRRAGGGINKRLFYSLPLAFLSTLLGPVKLQFSTLVLTKFVAHRAENKHSCIEKRENETHSSGQTQQSEVIHGITQYGNRKKHRTSASIFLSVRCVDASCHQVRRK